MQVGIFGTGSIGKRHAANVKQLVPKAKFLFFRSGGENETTRLYNAKVSDDDEEIKDCDLVIIANPSSLHFPLLEKVMKANIACYIEKPVVTEMAEAEKLEELLGIYKAPSMAGCNLRFMPSLIKLKKLLDSGAIGTPVRAMLEVGQYLPDWRKNTDYRKSYSAVKNLGGGVIFDLVHEIDLARWLFGEFDIVKSVHGSFSGLEIETEDAASIILARKGKPPIVSVNLDYVSRKLRRKTIIIGTEGNLTWDLPARSLTVETADEVETVELTDKDFDGGETYVTAMAQLLQAIKNGNKTSQDLADGLSSAKLAIKAKSEC